jgi:hypothetical protein
MHGLEHRQVRIEVGWHGRDRPAGQVGFVLVAEDHVPMTVVIFGGGSGLRPFKPGECDQVRIGIVAAADCRALAQGLFGFAPLPRCQGFGVIGQREEIE